MRRIVSRLLCTLLGHPNWVSRPMEDAVLRTMAEFNASHPEAQMSMQNSCWCGTKMKPFKAREIR